MFHRPVHHRKHADGRSFQHNPSVRRKPGPSRAFFAPSPGRTQRIAAAVSARPGRPRTMVPECRTHRSPSSPMSVAVEDQLEPYRASSPPSPTASSAPRSTPRTRCRTPGSGPGGASTASTVARRSAPGSFPSRRTFVSTCWGRRVGLAPGPGTGVEARRAGCSHARARDRAGFRRARGLGRPRSGRGGRLRIRSASRSSRPSSTFRRVSARSSSSARCSAGRRPRPPSSSRRARRP